MTTSSVARMTSWRKERKKSKCQGRAQGRLLHHSVDITEAQIVLGRDVQIFGAVLDQLGSGSLSGLEPSFDGCGASGEMTE